MIDKLLKYITDNRLEYHAINMAMFNNIGFYFIPIIYPTINKEYNEMSFGAGKKNYNLLSAKNNSYTLFSPEIIDEDERDEDFDKFIALVNRMCLHPEHIYGYTARYKDDVWACYIYDKGASGIEDIRNLIISDFIEQASINSIFDLHKYIEESFEIQKKYKVNRIKLDKGYFENGIGGCTAPALLFDEKIITSLRMVDNIDEEYVRLQYFSRLITAENEVFEDRTMPISTSITRIINASSGKVYGIGFQTEFKQFTNIKTNIYKDITIIDNNDKISDIIFNIVLELNANSLEFYVATGYAFESGLNMLESVYQALEWQYFAGKGISKMELIIGALQNYNDTKKISELNYATAEKINDMIDKGYFSGIYTYPNAFYHGKFYYISNGEVSYVITGSSNVTESAYCNNYELDMLYRFERKNGVICELEQSFISWYKMLKDKCIMFEHLDSNLFPRNMHIDESGNALTNSLKRKITEPEERERYELLMSYNPVKVDEKTLKNRRDIRPFKGYIIFEYPQYGLTLLESFKFGNACYIFGTCNVNRLQNTLIGKTKEKVQESSLYLTHIEHNENYAQVLKEVLNMNRKNN